MEVSVSQTALLAIVTVRSLASLTTVAARMMVRSLPLPQETIVDVIPPNPSHPAFKSSHSTSSSSHSSSSSSNQNQRRRNIMRLKGNRKNRTCRLLALGMAFKNRCDSKMYTDSFLFENTYHKY